MTPGELARRIIWAQRRKLVLGLLLLLVDRAAGFVMPLAPKVLLDRVITERRQDLLPVVAAAVVLAACVQAAASFGLMRILGLSAEYVVLGWRRRLMGRITRLETKHLETMQSGALLSRIMDDTAAMQNLVGAQLARWTSNILTSIAAFIALLLIDWKMTLVALTFAALPLLGLDLYYRRLRPLFRERGQLRSRVTGRLAQTLAGMRVVKVHGAEKREQLVFARGLHQLFRVMSQTTNRRGAMHVVAAIISAGVIAIVIMMGGNAILAGRMTLGDLGSYVAFAMMFAAPLVDLPEIATRVTETLTDLDRIREIEALPIETSGTEEARTGDIVFEHVSFEYVSDKPVLQDLSLTIKEGETVAIVGPSGAGKSTIFALLMAIHHPSKGAITIGGANLATMRLRDWRRTLGVVLQDDFLFDGTIAENIALGRPEATREEILAASQTASTLPLETVVGERGLKLSGGQRQRVSIARAIVKNAPILLFDEATSSLDNESEADVRAAMAALGKGRTVIIIAHRLSTVRSADQIVVLDRGRIVETGKHEDLIARAGRYATLAEPKVGS